MKLFVVFSIALVSLSLTAQNERVNDSFIAIEKALTEHQPELLVPYLADEMLLSFLGEEDYYQSKEFVQWYTTAAEKNELSNFLLKHKGAAKDGSSFLVGDISSQSGLLRVYIVIRDNLIEELCIDTE